MGKRLRRGRSICCCCVSPPSSRSSQSFFACYEEDLWIEIAKYLDGKSLVMLAATCCWFKRIMMEECVWKFACLRDLQVPDPQKVAFSWARLYATAYDGSHSFMFRQQDKHIGTLQIVDARHIELFLSEGYQNGSWEYEQIGHREIKKHADGASGAIFDAKHLRDATTSEIFNLKSWVGKPNEWQPKAMITLHAFAVNTNLQENEGLHVKYHVMRAGAGGEVVSIRISQQLI